MKAREATPAQTGAITTQQGWGFVLAAAIPVTLLIIWLFAVPIAPYGDQGRQSLWAWLLHYWSDPQWQHAIFAIPIALWLAYRQREQAGGEISGARGLVGVAMMLGGLLLLLASHRLYLVIIGLFGLQLLLAGTVLWLLGWRTLRLWKVPLLLLFFAWPLPFIEAELGFQLRHLSTKASHLILSVIPALEVFREGTTLSFLGGEGTRLHMSVDGPCSGLRGLFSLTMAAAIYGHLHSDGAWRKIVLLAAAPVIAIIANTIRLVVLAIGSRLWGLDFAIGIDGGTSGFHTGAGIVTLGLGLAAIMGISSLLGTTSGIPKAKGTQFQPATPSALWRLSLPLILSGIVMGICWANPHLALGDQPKLSKIPLALPGLHGTAGEIMESEKVGLPTDVEIDRVYYVGTPPWDKFPEDHSLAATVIQSGADRRAIHRPEVCLTAQGWNIDRIEELSMTLPSGRSLPYKYLSLTKEAPDGTQHRAHYQYFMQGDEIATTSHLQRITLSARDAVISGENYRWAAVNVFALESTPAVPALYKKMAAALSAIAEEIGAGNAVE